MAETFTLDQATFDAVVAALRVQPTEAALQTLQRTAEALQAMAVTRADHLRANALDVLIENSRKAKKAFPLMPVSR